VVGVVPERIALLLSGALPPRLVNPEVWPAYEQRRARILP
jgi:D-3-phosphoglycerate dehydrogenase / 2-oxoglutarate reductase